MNTTEAILEMLRKTGRVSGEGIASKIGVSRTAVWKSINGLREMGYEIEGDAKGYRLVSPPDSLIPLELSPQLTTERMGKRIDYHEAIESTNARARLLAEEGWSDGGLVVAEVQKEGKGRLGRTWESPRGGIWMSIILRPDLSPSEAPILTLAGGLAVIRAMDSHGLKGNLKWPNDVLLEDKKVCGILTEMSGEMDRIEYIVMGIGINANFDMGELPSELRDRVTTLQEAVGSPVNRKRLLADVLAEFEALYESDGAEVLANWKGRSSTMGRRVRVRTQRTDIEGVAVDLTSSGALVIELDSGERRTVLSGDCIYLKKD